MQEDIPGQRLTSGPVKCIVERVCQSIHGGDGLAGWRDMDHGRPLAGETNDLITLRQAIGERVLEDIESYHAEEDVLAGQW